MPQFSSCGFDRAARIVHRVSALDASGTALKRSIKAVTFVSAAPSVSRRLALRSSTLCSPTTSIATAPSAEQLSASDAARSASSACATRKIRNFDGSMPSSSNPVAAISPNSIPEKSCRIQRMGLPFATRAARPTANPVAVASCPVAANTSCSAPFRRPPCRNASASAIPSGMRTSLSSSVGLASAALRACIRSVLIR